MSLKSACIFDMTLSAHQRSVFLGLVTAFTIAVKGFHQAGLLSGVCQSMAIRAALVLGRLIFHQTVVFIINMVAQVAFFNFGAFIVFIMPEYRRRTPGILENIRFDRHHVFLRVCRMKHDQRKQRHY